MITARNRSSRAGQRKGCVEPKLMLHIGRLAYSTRPRRGYVQLCDLATRAPRRNHLGTSYA